MDITNFEREHELLNEEIKPLVLALDNLYAIHSGLEAVADLGPSEQSQMFSAALKVISGPLYGELEEELVAGTESSIRDTAKKIWEAIVRTITQIFNRIKIWLGLSKDQTSQEASGKISFLAYKLETVSKLEATKKDSELLKIVVKAKDDLFEMAKKADKSDEPNKILYEASSIFDEVMSKVKGLPDVPSVYKLKLDKQFSDIKNSKELLAKAQDIYSFVSKHVESRPDAHRQQLKVLDEFTKVKLGDKRAAENATTTVEDVITKTQPDFRADLLFGNKKFGFGVQSLAKASKVGVNVVIFSSSNFTLTSAVPDLIMVDASTRDKAISLLEKSEKILNEVIKELGDITDDITDNKTNLKEAIDAMNLLRKMDGISSDHRVRIISAKKAAEHFGKLMPLEIKPLETFRRKIARLNTQISGSNAFSDEDIEK